tara:strand:+ start:593 stop:958 length:366 start_codon:yes stop_codon:yes gene_type:complete
MKKSKHRYNIGDIVKFKFLTGDVYTGKITDHTFKEDKTPSYKIRVEENTRHRTGFTVYPCMTDSRIISLEMTAMKAMKAGEIAYREMKRKENATAIKASKDLELEKAIKAQEDFTNGDIEK